MTNSLKFYTPSDQLQPTNLIIALILGLIISSILAYLYNLLSTFIPIVYFNVLITIGLGMAIGLASRIIGRMAKLINKKSKLILVVTMAVSTFIFQWVAFLGTLKAGISPGFVEYLGDIPSTLFAGEHWSNLGDLYTYGAWSIGGLMFNKFLLLMVWLVEMGIILILPFMSVRQSPEYPYSESQNKWYAKYTLSDQFESMSSKRYFLDDHLGNPLNAIKGLQLGDGWRHGKVHIYYLDGVNDAYMSFEKVFIEGRGKGKKTSSYLIENLRLSQQEARSILNEFHHEKDRMDVF